MSHEAVKGLSAVIGLNQFLQQFRETLGVAWDPPTDLSAAAVEAIEACGIDNAVEIKHRRSVLLSLVNSKFGLNAQRFKEFLDGAATRQVFLNYHDKVEVREAFDSSDVRRFDRWLISRGLGSDLRELFNPIEVDETLRLLADQLKNPKVVRSDARDCDPEERRESILRSLFGSFIFYCFPVRRMHEHLNRDCRTNYLPDFYDHLQHFHPSVLHRQRALSFVVIDDELRNALGDSLRDSLYQFLELTYLELSNHCWLAILIKPFRDGTEDGQWKLFSDLVLYAEKHRETKLTTGYFRPEAIEAATLTHGVPLTPGQGRFDIANEGFFFKDCMVLPQQHDTSVETTSAHCDLLVLFEKNERDETLVPCPACRSSNVRGNSYPVLGVKSWECQHPLCPDRSAFDRGNRYSVAALIKRQAIASDEDQIPTSSLRRWKLDLVPNVNEAEIVEMILRHFSLHGDTVQFINTAHYGTERFGRQIKYASLSRANDDVRRYETFQNSALFSRFALKRPTATVRESESVLSGADDVDVYRGDSFSVLAGIDAETVDGAVTSPPYYNARSYSVWPNIYCYLYDMYNVAHQVYRVLRPGAYYLFNIFDYFDNENSIAFSAMGKKRMILGPYIINLFRRIGFAIQGNTVWFKGEIEGKRNFNQGNRSPYYQLPLNCWEHILIFQKPGGQHPPAKFPNILAARPVIKMVRGENTLGHSAPFPPAIPELLITQMRKGECVLDPFSGSMTTGRTARRYGLRSLSVDLHREYCELGLRLLREEEGANNTSQSALPLVFPQLLPDRAADSLHATLVSSAHKSTKRA